MKLVTGGAFQGKWDYARKRYQVYDGWIDGADCEPEEIGTCRGILHFHEYIRRLLERQTGAGGDAGGRGKEESRPWELSVDSQAQAFADFLMEKNPEIILVTNELGCGVVPIDPFDREYRETVGRICTCLASRADEVVRVVCGIGMILK